jgi:hypothetical protein
VPSEETQSTKDEGVEKREEGIGEHGIGERQRKDDKATRVDQIDGHKQQQVVL